MLFAITVLNCTAGCSPTSAVFAPSGDAPRLAATASAPSDSACRVIGFNVSPQPFGVFYPDRTGCGARLTLIQGGAPTYSSQPRRVTVPLRILNRAGIGVVSPVKLTLRPADISVFGGGSGTTQGTVTPTNADSLRADGTGVWLIGGAPTLSAGDSTAVRSLIFDVGNHVLSANLLFGVVSTLLGTVPAVAPDSTPAWFGNDSSYSANGLLKRVLDVRFISTATQTQKQAAVDSVAGIVVGGYHLSNDSIGVYTVYMPDVINDSALLARRERLKRQPGVDRALLRELGKPSGVRPVDGVSWRLGDWAFNRDSSSNENWAFEEVSLPLAWGCQSGMLNPGLGLIESRLPHRRVCSKLSFIRPLARPSERSPIVRA